MTGGWRKLYNKELINLYPSPSVIKMIKPWRMMWVEGFGGKSRRKVTIIKT
jgi:hypothetical protein